ncbi:MAG TPA: P1 family peptidase, partial [Gemmatimonadota bacterium]|nr:P1 family peptidase [Gemmatimonadota bacterium]
QSNFGGALEIRGVPIGRILGRAEFLERWAPTAAIGGNVEPDLAADWRPELDPDAAGGSIMIVVATDAPVDAHALRRIAYRAPYAIARVGGFSSHGSGDYVIAFSTAEGLRIPHEADSPLRTVEILRGEVLGRFFLATVEATEEAILNSLFRATTVTGVDGHTAEALPIDEVRDRLAAAGVLGEGE